VPELRSIAPTVAVSNVPLSQILEELRSQGCSPAAEDESGISIDVRPEPAVVAAAQPAKKQRRSLAPDEHRERAGAPVLSTRHAHRDVPEETTEHHAAASAEEFTAVLRAAARGSHPVKITYANKHGEPTTVGATPVRIDGGQVDALVGTNTVRFPLHR